MATTDKDLAARAGYLGRGLGVSGFSPSNSMIASITNTCTVEPRLMAATRNFLCKSVGIRAFRDDMSFSFFAAMPDSLRRHKYCLQTGKYASGKTCKQASTLVQQGIMARRPPRESSADKIAALKQMPQFISVKRASEMTTIPEARLLELCQSGHAPHYRVDGGETKFRSGEIQEWVKDNLISVSEGHPLPRAMPVWMEAEKLGLSGQPPLCLRGIERLHQCVLPPRVCGIYFLCKDKELVYVGQSVDVYTRIVAHRPGKDFDTVYYVAVPPSELDRIEGAFIRILKPCLNGNPGPTTDQDAHRIVMLTLGMKEAV